MANEEVKVKFKADMKEAFQEVKQFEQELGNLSKIGSNQKFNFGFLKKGDIDQLKNIGKISEESAGKLQQVYSQVLTELANKEQEIMEAVANNSEKAIVDALKAGKKELELYKQEIEANIQLVNNMQDTLNKQSRGLSNNMQSSLSNMLSGGGNISSLVGQGAGKLASSLTGLSSISAPMLALTAGITLLTGAIIKLTKQGAQSDKKIDTYTARISQQSRYFDDGAVWRKAGTTSRYYSREETAIDMENFISQAGAESSLDNLSKDVGALQEGALAIGASKNSVIQGGSQLKRVGALKDGEMGNYLNIVTGIVDKAKANGREDEVIKNLEHIVDNTYATQLKLSDVQVQNLADAQANLTDILGVDYEKGAEIANTMNSALIGSSSDYNFMTQAIMSANGWEGFEGMHKAKRQLAQGLSNPNNLNNLIDQYASMGENMSQDSLSEVILQSGLVGNNIELADKLAEKLPEFKNMDEDTRAESIKQLENEYAQTDDAYTKTIDANVADIATWFGEIYNDIKNGVLGRLTGIGDSGEEVETENMADSIREFISGGNSDTGEGEEGKENISRFEKIRLNALANTAQYGSPFSDETAIGRGINNITQFTNKFSPIGRINKKITKFMLGLEDGSHATGLEYVPRDNYLANLHEGEQVLTKQQASLLRRGSSRKDNDPENLIVSSRNRINEKARKNLEEEDTVLEKRKSIEETFYKSIQMLDSAIGQLVNADLTMKLEGNGTTDDSGSVVGSGNVGSLSTSDFLNYDLNGISESGGDPTHGLTEQQVNAYLNSKTKQGSTMRNQGKAYLQASKESGLDIWYLIAHSALETGWGSSNISGSKSNMYGIGAFDNSPYASAYGYDNASAGIIEGAKWIAKNYANGQYQQDTLDKMRHNNGTHEYATDDSWSNKIAEIMSGVSSSLAGSGTNVNNTVNVNVNGSGGTSAQNTDLANKVANTVSKAIDLRYKYTIGKQ